MILATNPPRPGKGKQLELSLRQLLLLILTLAILIPVAACSFLPCPTEGYEPLTVPQYEKLCKNNGYQIGACSLRRDPPRCRARAPESASIRDVNYVVYDDNDYSPGIKEFKSALFADRPLLEELDIYGAGGAGGSDLEHLASRVTERSDLDNLPSRLVAILGPHYAIATVNDYSLYGILIDHGAEISFLGASAAVITADFGNKQVCFILGGHGAYPEQRLACEAAFSGITCGFNCLNRANDSEMLQDLRRRK